jgi:hypothetical protein
MTRAIKNLLLSFLLLVLFGCSHNLKQNTLIYQNKLEQNRYSNFIKTTLFSESFNQAVNKIAGKNFPGKNIGLFPLTGDMTPKKFFSSHSMAKDMSLKYSISRMT